MKITDSSISMVSQHTLNTLSFQQETSKFRLDFEKFSTGNLQDAKVESYLPGEGNNGQLSLVFLTPVIDVDGSKWYKVEPLSEVPEMDRQKMLILERFLSILTGKKMRFRMHREDGALKADFAYKNKLKIIFSVEKRIDHFYRENEKISFSANGIFKTADGKEINFHTDLNLGREFASLNNVTRNSEQELLDPLVINYNGLAASLTDTKFSFDLDGNGQRDLISFVDENSGLLALDLNMDGKINDGKELFGATSGDGFKELATYDADRNGWIDESDSIYDRLRIWTKDNEGKDSLFALGQKGVGAIYLGNIEAQFSLKSSTNQDLGEVKKVGLFAKEDGSVGTVQQIDFVV